MNRLLLMSLIAMLTLGTQTAHADAGDDRQKLVHFDDLNLARPAGVATLYHRLQKAADAVCEPLNPRSLERANTFKYCVADTLSRAVSEMDQPALTSYYRAALNGRNAVPREALARQ
jgi:UrcA family protein